MIVILVESPNKAKAINEYLSSEKEKYVVLSTFGHIRNLIKKDGSVDVDNDFEYKWETTPTWKKNSKDVLEKIKEAKQLLIASDLDREGEAICWHVMEVLKAKKITTPTKRIVFNSVSKKDILNAINNQMDCRMGMVESYLSRIGLDYLFGFSISPLLWHKIPCCKSAGRVQSVALRLITERENEILNFKSEKYITVHAKFKNLKKETTLIELEGEKFENGQIFKKEINNELFGNDFTIKSIKTNQMKQNAAPPLITATLQQLASSKLNLSPNMTMSLAQKLFEGFTINNKHVGLITYMRTDSLNISPDAIIEIRKKIETKYGKEFLPAVPNVHSKKVKNAQEAHEAIRPVDINLEPGMLNLGDKNLENLYKLIWETTIASQCTAAILEKTNMIIESKKEPHYKSGIFELKTSKTIFQGFKEVYYDAEEDEIEETIDFSNFKENDKLDLEKIEQKEHETAAPKRFSEATLIQQLKNKGIGRPSTYAKIITVLYEREYAEKNKKTIVPTQKGFIVTAFLKHFFKDEVQYEFTSKIEEELDELMENNLSHKTMVSKFWKNLDTKIANSKNTNPLEVFSSIEKEYKEYFLANSNKCSKCGNNMLLKITKFGALRGCSNYPECSNTINLYQKSEKLQQQENGDISLKNGPYGYYVEVKTDPIKRIPVPKPWQKDIENLSKERIQLLSELPKNIGEYKNEKLTLNIGKFGPYVKFKSFFISIKDIENIDFNDLYKKIEEKIKI